MEMAKNKGAKYFDVTSVSHFTKKILDQLSFKGWYFSIEVPLYHIGYIISLLYMLYYIAYILTSTKK